MAYISHYTPSRQPKGNQSRSRRSGQQVGRVVYVILSLEDPNCTSATMVNGVFYRDLKVAVDENSTDGLNFAYQSSTNMRTLPVEGELVSIVTKAAAGKGGKPGISTRYWTDIIPVNNHPHYNAAPDTKQENWQNNLEKNFKELADINPLQANPGDLLIEGRYGQSIRVGGGKGENNPIIDNSNEGKPIILIRNGQLETTNGNDIIREDINKDPNSLYFVADHKIPLQAANTKRDSYTTVPTTSNQYKGNQVLLNGGRVFINAKEESVFISAKESVGINGKTVNIDAQEYFCIDADKIYLGKSARISQVKEPAVLGVQLENWLNVLLDSLDTLSTALSTAAAVTGGPVTQLNSAGPSLKATVTSLRTQIKQFQSNKVYTE